MRHIDLMGKGVTLNILLRNGDFFDIFDASEFILE